MSVDPKLRSRLLIGAIAGAAGTMAMTVALSRLHRQVRRRKRDPMPPDGAVDSTAAHVDAAEEAALDLTTADQFVSGAVAGSLIAAINPRISPITGTMAGVAIWAASYLRWLSGVGLLKAAALHPRRRNALTLVAHIMWGMSTARALRELLAARETMLQSLEENKDAPDDSRHTPDRL